MSQEPESNSEMPVRTLGRTGVRVSLIGLGGWHLGFKYIDEDLSIRIIRTAIDSGIKKDAAKQLDESLKRMQTDHIDLVQHHEILRFEDPHRIFAREGANEALLEAREAGKISFIGFTGHKDPQIHLHMLDVARENDFQFDTVQMPLNVMDAHYRSFEKIVLPRLVDENSGVLAMKTLANGTILESKTVSAI